MPDAIATPAAAIPSDTRILPVETVGFFEGTVMRSSIKRGCFQYFLIPCKWPLPTTATTELCSLAVLSNVDDMNLNVYAKFGRFNSIFNKKYKMCTSDNIKRNGFIIT